MEGSTRTQKEGKGPAAPRPIVRIVLSIAIIAAGIAGARYLIHTKPKVNRRPPVKMAPLVKTVPLQLDTYKVTVQAMGEVIPAREMTLSVPVAGEIINISPEFTQGGLLQENTIILQIDPKDYELALQQKQRSLSDAEYAYKLELGRQDVARKEWDLLYGDKGYENVESELALRKPHLEKAKVDVDGAKAELEEAQLNLARTTVATPFNTLVLNKYVEQGSHVSAQEKLADLVGTDAYWVQVSIPVEELKWLRIPRDSNEEGAPATINYRETNKRQGRVIRLLADLSQKGRMARLLVEVKDPLDLQVQEGKRPPLLIGEYVRVVIEGDDMPEVFRIPRYALHNDNQVWILDKEAKLSIRPVATIWRDEEFVFVRDGLQPQEQLVISPLATPVDGMQLRIEENGAEEQEISDTLPESKEQEKP